MAGFGQRYSKPNVYARRRRLRRTGRQTRPDTDPAGTRLRRSRWFVSSTIIGASSLAQLKETLPATQTPISAELLAEIDAIHLRYTNPAP
jgi:aryl-alcohol dehydrogenase-like predicted oxidoreductase